MREKYFLVMFSVVLILGMSFVLSEPSGANLTPGESTSAGSVGAGSDTNAVAGNITEMNISGTSNTQSWQGYYGNVTGSIQLADGDGAVLYNWSSLTPSGEVYAANVSSLNWSGIGCYDMANHETLESDFGIESGDVDGVNETFNRNDHDPFFTNNVEFTAGNCSNTKLYDDTGTGSFDEVLLTDGTYPIFASILKDDATGFTGGLYDFEMIVLEDGHNGDSATDTYYFWVELE